MNKQEKEIKKRRKVNAKRTLKNKLNNNKKQFVKPKKIDPTPAAPDSTPLPDKQ